MDISQAEGGTRSGLLWEFERIISELTEKQKESTVLIMENVPQIHSAKDMPNFIKWQERLEELGYVSYWKDLNAKDFGIPQNRERTFMVSVYGKNYQYKFPNEIKREYNLKDFLEDKVDEKYYLSKKMIDYLTGVNQKESKYDRGAVFERNFNENKDVAATITTAAGQRPTDNFITEEYQGNGVAIKIVNNTEQGYLEAHEGDGINIGSRMHHQRGNVQPGMAQTIKTSGGNEIGVIEEVESVFTETEISLFTEDGNIRRYIGSEQIDEFKEGQMATTSYPNGYGHGTRVHNESITLNTIDRPVVKNNLRIRKLTPRECLRLMAFTDEDYLHIKEIGFGDGAIFHVAGDSIVVTTLLGIIGKLYGLNNQETEKAIRKYIEEIRL